MSSPNGLFVIGDLSVGFFLGLYRVREVCIHGSVCVYAK